MGRLLGTPISNSISNSNNNNTLHHHNSNKPLWKQEARDWKGRKRFHGAFTGGFSAGYHNTTGSREGWQPSSFTSSRITGTGDNQNKRSYASVRDFMDEEDYLDKNIKIIYKLALAPSLKNQQPSNDLSFKAKNTPFGFGWLGEDEDDTDLFKDQLDYSKAITEDGEGSTVASSRTTINLVFVKVGTLPSKRPDFSIIKPGKKEGPYPPSHTDDSIVNHIDNDDTTTTNSMEHAVDNVELDKSKAMDAKKGFIPFTGEKLIRYIQYLDHWIDPLIVDLHPNSTHTESIEFYKSAIIFRPLSTDLAKRFVAGSHHLDDNEQKEKTRINSSNDSLIASKQELLKIDTNKVGRRVEEWTPTSLLCKRLNVSLSLSLSKT